MADYATFNTYFYNHLDRMTVQNNQFRKVIATTPNMQLVLMSLQPGDEIGEEVHPYATQFIRVEQGDGLAIIEHRQCHFSDGDAIIVPLNTLHNVINTSKTKPLQLYTLYSPPQHATQ